MAKLELAPLVCSGLEVSALLVGRLGVDRFHESHAATASLFTQFSMYTVVALAGLAGFVIGLAALAFASERRIVAATVLAAHALVNIWVVSQLSNARSI